MKIFKSRALTGPGVLDYYRKYGWKAVARDLIHDVVARVVRMPGESEDVTASGAMLMYAGVKLKQAFAATGYDERVRFYPDFFSRLYFMEAEN